MSSDSASALLPRTRLVERLLSTPPGGMCVLASDPGFGRRTLVNDVLGRDTVVVDLADPSLQPAGGRTLLTEALESLPAPGWLVVLNVTGARPELTASAVAEATRDLGERRIALVCTPEVSSLFANERLEGVLVDIDQEDLCLTQEESLELLASWSSHLDPSQRAEVTMLCDGWLRALVAVRQQHEDRPERDTLGWLRTYGAELLLGRWLDSQADDVRDMLLQTAILDELTPELVDAVTQADVGWTLPTVAHPRGALRISSRRAEQDRVWFARHPLLTSLVRYRAAGRDSQARHRRAAAWFRLNGDLGPELVHLLSAGDAEAAVERFEQIESQVLLSGQADLALRWYEELPVSQVAEHLLRVAWAHALASRLPQARQVLYRLRSLSRDVAADGSVLDVDAEIDVVEAWLAERTGDIGTTVAAAARANKAFGPSWQLNSHQIAVLLLARGRMMQGDIREADRILASVRNNPFTSPVLGEGRRADTEAAVAWADGNINQARAWAARYDRWLRSQKPERTHSRFLPSITGYLCGADRGDYDEALHGLTRVADVAGTAGATMEQVEALLAIAELHRQRWQLSLAWEQTMLARAAVIEHSPDGGLLPHIAAAQIRIRLMSGDHVRAQRLLKGLGPSTTRQLLNARIALVKTSSHAVTLIREIDPRTIRGEVERGVLSAWASSATSRQQAEEDLIKMADVATQYGLTSALVDVPQPLLDIARRAAAYHVHDPLDGLVRVAVEARVAGHQRSAPVPRSDVVLTRGELELLALLPTRATYGGIAERLGVSVNTVKTRLRRLYAKLGAPDRETAIANAGRLGLLTRTRR